jgi:hypothetical protein
MSAGSLVINDLIICQPFTRVTVGASHARDNLTVREAHHNQQKDPYRV